MAALIKSLAEGLLKAIPLKQRTRTIGLLQLVYAIVGVLTHHLTPEQAGIIGTTAIGLLTARSAADQPSPE